MPGPLFIRVGSRAQSASAATISPAKPSVDTINGILLAVVTSKNNATHSTATSGWALVSQTNSGASFTMSVWRALESTAAPTFTWTGAVACSAQIAYYADPDNPTITVGTPTTSSGLTATHTSTAVTTVRHRSTVVYIDCAAANTALATPTGWTEDVDAGSATDAGRTVFGNKQVSVAGTSSGSISVTGANAAWVQIQVEIGGTTISNTADFSKVELAAWVEPPNGANFSKAELAAWVEPPAGASFAKVELGAWLDKIDVFAVSKVELGAWLDYTAFRRRQIININ